MFKKILMILLILFFNVSVFAERVSILETRNLLSLKENIYSFNFEKPEKVITPNQDFIESDSTPNRDLNVFNYSPSQINDRVLYDMLVYYHVKEPKIVLAQAKLETGNYKSNLCVKYFNLFGIKAGHQYAHYKSYDESIHAYLTKIQYRWKEGKETYWNFLKRIGYSTSSTYIVHVKKMMQSIKL